MYPRTISALTAAVVLLCAVTARGADPVAAWLRRIGCDQLLADHLESLLEGEDQSVRQSAAEELAGLYAVMLALATDETRVQVMRRASSLLERIPEAGTDRLRLQLLRGSYLAAEETLEQRRMRLVDQTIATAALEQLSVIRKRLATMDPALTKRARSGGRSAQAMADAANATYLLAWTEYYLARQRQDAALATQAANRFASLLEGRVASLQEVSTDLRSRDVGARSILGIALCKAVAKDPGGPEPWLELLEDDTAWDDVRRRVPLWRLRLAVDNRRWSVVLKLLEQDSVLVDTIWYRLAAVHALEDPQSNVAGEVARQAIAAMAAAGQLEQVYDIADQYPEWIRGQRGFVADYVAGAMAFREAEGKAKGSEAVVDPVLQREFLEAARLFREALAAPDVAKAGRAEAACRELLGRCLWRAGDVPGALKALAGASEAGQGETATWMAIVCIDRLGILDLEQQGLRETLVDRYLANWPGTPRAGRLMVREASREGASEATIGELLDVPTTHAGYEDAQRLAASMLYAKWREADQLQKSEAGNAYLNVAVPLAVADTAAADADTAQWAVSRCLRILEVSLDDAVGRSVAASTAMKSIESLTSSGKFDGTTLERELAYRQAKLLAVQGKTDELIAAANDMVSKWPSDRWASRAARLAFNAARRGWSAGHGDLAAEVWRLGQDVIERGGSGFLDGDAGFASALDTVRSGTSVYLANEDEAMGTEVLGLARRLARRRPKDVTLLRTRAVLEEEVGDQAAAIEAWRTLGAGLPDESEAWFEARFHLIEGVGRMDADRGGKLLSQHLVMYPGGGPPPWGPRFEAMKAAEDDS